MGKKIFDIPDSFLLEMIKWYLTMSGQEVKLPKDYEILSVMYNPSTNCWEVLLSSLEFTEDENGKERL